MKFVDSIAKDSAKFLIGNFVVLFIGALRGLVFPKIVAPDDYGLWRLVFVAWQFGMFLHLGSFAYLNRELPGLIAVGKWKEVAEIQQMGY